MRPSALQRSGEGGAEKGDQRQWNGLSAGINANAEQIIDPARKTPSASAVEHYGAGRLLPKDHVLGPTAQAQGRIDQFSARIGFVQRHKSQLNCRPGLVESQRKRRSPKALIFQGGSSFNALVQFQVILGFRRHLLRP